MASAPRAEQPARLSILPAKAAPKACILRRKPSKVFHVMLWNTKTDHVMHGSWFRGRIYEDRSDISWDGERLVYLAVGHKGATWNGVCRLPWLKTEYDEPSVVGTWSGGGYWPAPGVLGVGWAVQKSTEGLAFRIAARGSTGNPETRDGWRYVDPKPFGAVDVRENRPSPKHPTLRHLRIRLKLRRSSTERTVYEIAEAPGLLDDTVDTAGWDSLGQLLVGRAGAIERYTLADIARGKPGFRRSFEDLQPNWKGPDHDQAQGAPANVR